MINKHYINDKIHVKKKYRGIGSGAKNGSDMTSAGIQTVAASSEEQSASMHEISDNAESLAELATELNAVVEKFKVQL